MSENEDLVREALESFNRQDREFANRVLHPDCELISPLADVRGHAYRGLDGATQWFDDIEQNFSRFQTEVIELSEVRDGRVLGLGQAKVLGRASGLDYEQPVGWVVDIERNRLRRIWIFFDHDEARRLAETL
jgi:ketosteroid isomerase-like protein